MAHVSPPQPRVESFSEFCDKERRSLCALEMHLQKTKLCTYHMKGRCKHSTACRFAHGYEELMQAPNLQKTRMCPTVLAGKRCDRFDCTFAHHENELKKVNICHKTVVCSWFLAGQCRNGTECSFAHGEHELKGNGKAMSQEQNVDTPVVRKNKRQQNASTFVRQSGQATEPLCQPLQVPPHITPENSLFSEPCPFQAPPSPLICVPPPAPPLPSVPPPPSPPGVGPPGCGFVNAMQAYVGQYSGPGPQQQEVLPVPLNYMSVPPAMQLFPDGKMSDGTPVQCKREHVGMEHIQGKVKPDGRNVTTGERVSSMQSPNQANKDREPQKQNNDLGGNPCWVPKGEFSARMVLATRPRSRSMDVPIRHGKDSDDGACLNLPGYVIKNTFINSAEDVDIDYVWMQELKNKFANLQVQVPSPDSTYASSRRPDSEEVNSSDGARPRWTTEDVCYRSASGVSTPDVIPPRDSGAAPGYQLSPQPFVILHSANIPAAPPPPTAPPPFPPNVNPGSSWGFDDSPRMLQEPSGVCGRFFPVNNLPSPGQNDTRNLHASLRNQQPQREDHQMGMAWHGLILSPHRK